MSEARKDVDLWGGIPRDTTPEAFRAYCDALRRLGPEERSRIAMRMNDQVWQTAADGIRRRHPKYSESQVRLALIRLRLGDKLFKIGYPNEDIAP